MKTKLILIITGLIVSAIGLGNGDLPIYENIQFVKNYEFIESGHNQIFVSSPFAKSDLNIPQNESFEGKKVKSVIYLYSHNNRNPKFGQSALSENRYNNLINQMSGADFSTAKWTTQVQAGCGTIACSRQLNHGFIIEFDGEAPVMSHENLEVQKRMIPNDKDMTLTFAQGTKIDVPANAFVDAFGNEVNGKVYIEVQEAYSLDDIVTAKLYTVTDNGEFLETRGMINVGAYQGDKKLYLKDGKEMTVRLPNEVDKDFSHFQGEVEDGKLVWSCPEPIVIEFKNQEANENSDNDAEVIEANKLLDADVAIINENDNQNQKESIIVLSWGHTNGVLSKIVMMKDNEEVVVWRQKATGSYLKGEGFRTNEILTINKWFDLQDVKLERQVYDENDENGREFVFSNFMIIGGNDHQVDNDISQVYKMKKMGWANVDRLAAKGPRKKLNVAQESVEDLDRFDISLVIPSESMFIPGYKKKDGKYSFTHGDYEETMPMPLGETAYIIAIGSKDDQTYFQIKEISLGQSEIENLSLSPANREDALSAIKNTL